MKISCWRTSEQKKLWHRVFKWWPVLVFDTDGAMTCYYLCYLDRRIDPVWTSYAGFAWEYRCSQGEEE